MNAVQQYLNRKRAGLPNHPGMRVSSRPVRTTFNIELTVAGPEQKPALILRGPKNRALWVKVLKQAIQAIGDREREQVDAGPGGVRLLIPASANLHDLYDHGRKKV